MRSAGGIEIPASRRYTGRSERTSSRPDGPAASGAPTCARFRAEGRLAGTREGAPSAIAVLRDDAGVAMPLVAQPDAEALHARRPDGARVVELPRARRFPVIQRGASAWVAVDYRRLDLDCRVTGTIVFERVADDALAVNVDMITRGLDARGRRDALRAAGNSRSAFEPAASGGIDAGVRTRPRSPADAERANQHRVAALGPGRVDSGTRALRELRSRASRRRSDRITSRCGAHAGIWHWCSGTWASYEEAESLLRQAAGRYEMLLDPDDAHGLGTLTNLGTLLCHRGQYVEAERTMLEAIVRFERTLGPDHPRTMIMLNNLAAMYDELGRPEEALFQNTTAVERYRRTLGPRHPATLRARHNHASMLAPAGPAQRSACGAPRGACGAARGDRSAPFGNAAEAARRWRLISRGTARSTRRARCSAKWSKSAKQPAARQRRDAAGLGAC